MRWEDLCCANIWDCLNTVLEMPFLPTVTMRRRSFYGILIYLHWVGFCISMVLFCRIFFGNVTWQCQQYGCFTLLREDVGISQIMLAVSFSKLIVSLIFKMVSLKHFFRVLASQQYDPFVNDKNFPSQLGHILGVPKFKFLHTKRAFPTAKFLWCQDDGFMDKKNHRNEKSASTKMGSDRKSGWKLTKGMKKYLFIWGLFHK